MTTEQKMRAKIAERTTEELCSDYEHASLLTFNRSVAIVMRFITDELENRDKDKCNAWLDTEDMSLLDSPSHFFLVAA